MRLVFAGTPAFAVPALEALHAAGHAIAAVYTQPDRPAGRGRKLQATAVAMCAQQLGLEVRKPARLDADAAAALAALRPDAMVVVAYGLILPEPVLAIPRLGCFNIHASLLPRWRGAAPVQRAILAGDTETGVTIMRMDRGLDTGPMLLQERVPVAAQTTAGELLEQLAPLGAQLMVRALAGLAAGTLADAPQPADGVTYASKVTKDEARLDWSKPAAELARAVRAFNPAPVAWTELDGERVRIQRAAPAPRAGDAAPGTVIGIDFDGIAVATGDGVLSIRELQRPGGTVLPAAVAARGWNVAGQRFR
jgi:methionyl-tRNA formyltransferase